MNTTIQTLKRRIAAHSVAEGMLNTRILVQKEKLKRQKVLDESQFKLRLFAVEADAKARIEDVKDESHKKAQDFLGNVCRLFKDMADVQQPISIESVEGLLISVRTRLDRCEQARSSKKRRPGVSTAAAPENTIGK
jgi:hypothetical protein